MTKHARLENSLPYLCFLELNKTVCFISKVNKNLIASVEKLLVDNYLLTIDLQDCSFNKMRVF
jgi:hypothetical protein